MRRWLPLTLLLVGCAGETLDRPSRATYCVEGPIRRDQRLVVLWPSRPMQIALDVPFPPDGCVRVPEPEDPTQMGDGHSVILKRFDGVRLLRMEGHAPVFLAYLDLDGDARFTPQDTVIQQATLDVFSGGLLWIANYRAALDALRASWPSLLFRAQPEPGVPFVFAKPEGSLLDPEFVPRPFELHPQALRPVHEVCEVERQLPTCGPSTTFTAAGPYTTAPPTLWRSPALPPEILQGAPTSGEASPIDSPPERLVTSGQVCVVWRGLALFSHYVTYLETDPAITCDCRLLINTTVGAAPVDQRPDWWPCDPAHDPDLDAEATEVRARNILEGLELHAPDE